MKIDPNKPAFPHMGNLHRHNPETGESDIEPIMTGGLSIRAHFASLAMQGLLADSTIDGSAGTIAEMAVENADALIAELNK